MIATAALVTLLLAPLPDALADCRKVGDDAKRLACYDALSAPPPEEVGEVRANLVGQLSGWRRGTRFTLDNGQVWECIDEGRDDIDLDQSAVIIRRNFVGTYWMSIAGETPLVRVSRVK